MRDHVAILDPALHLLPKIVSGRKTVESRWYVHRASPWGRVAKGDRVFFRNSGGSVEAVAGVARVEFHVLGSREDVARLVRAHGGEPGICFPWGKGETVRRLAGKRYAILMFLKGAKRVEPFRVDKTGFGNACAWMVVGDIERVRLAGVAGRRK